MYGVKAARSTRSACSRSEGSAFLNVRIIGSGQTELVRDLVFGSERPQLVPGCVLDFDAVLAALLLAQIFDLARIKHTLRPFRRRRRFEIARELADFLLEFLQRPERGDVEHRHEAAVVVTAGR